jgi:hypothetical protein
LPHWPTAIFNASAAVACSPQAATTNNVIAPHIIDRARFMVSSRMSGRGVNRRLRRCPV